MKNLNRICSSSDVPGEGLRCRDLPGIYGVPTARAERQHVSVTAAVWMADGRRGS